MCEKNKPNPGYQKSYNDFLEVKQTVWGKHQQGLSYIVNPPVEFRTKRKIGTISMNNSASRIELLATTPTFDKEGEVILKLNGASSYCVYRSNNLLKIKKYFDKFNLKMESRQKVICFGPV